MRQVCIIHGGSTYRNKDEYIASLKDLEIAYDRLLYQPRWNTWLAQELPDTDLLLPSMPNIANAQYDEWSIYFSKIIPFLAHDVILIGHSLGGIFLAKYLTERPLESPCQKLILLAAPYDNEENESLGSFKIGSSVINLTTSAREIYLLHSIDDPVVPFQELHDYQRDLPDAEVRVFHDRQHFNIPVFRELLDIIKK